MEVTEHIEVTSTTLVPLSDGFVDRDVDTPDSSAITHGVTVMKTDDVSVDVQVGVVSRGDDESHTLVLGEQVGKVVVHVELERVALLGGDVGLLGDARVIACVANNGDVQVGLS